MENKKNHKGTLSSGLVARLERVANFLTAFYKSLGIFVGDDEVPKGNWISGAPVGDHEFKQLVSRLNEFGFEAIFRSPAMVRRVCKEMHRAIAEETGVREPGTLKDILIAQRALMRIETLVAKMAPKSELAERLLAAGVVERKRDRHDAVDTFYDVYEAALTDAIAVMTHQIAEARREAIAKAKAAAKKEED